MAHAEGAILITKYTLFKLFYRYFSEVSQNYHKWELHKNRLLSTFVHSNPFKAPYNSQCGFYQIRIKEN
jgi:hypothetical protein